MESELFLRFCVSQTPVTAQPGVPGIIPQHYEVRSLIFFFFDLGFVCFLIRTSDTAVMEVSVEPLHGTKSVESEEKKSVLGVPDTGHGSCRRAWNRTMALRSVGSELFLRFWVSHTPYTAPAGMPRIEP